MDTNTLDALDTVMARIHESARRANGGYNDEREADPASVVTRHYDDVTLSGPRGTMRAWMQAHDGRKIHTVQVGNDGRNPWAPTYRTVDASQRAGGVFLSDSFREYKGMRVIHATADALIATDDWQTVLYVDANPTH